MNTENPNIQNSINDNIVINQSSNLSYAKLYSRLASFWIDTCILFIPSILIYSVSYFVFFSIFGLSFNILGSATQSFASSIVIGVVYSFILFILISIIPVLYYTYFLPKSGQTLGMRFVGIKMIKNGGLLLSFLETLVRFLVYSFVAYLIGIFNAIPLVGWVFTIIGSFFWFGWCLFDSKKQNLYDKIFNNLYVSENENTGRSKMVIGCCCGAQLIATLILTAIIIFIVSATFGNKDFQGIFNPSTQFQNNIDMNLELKTDNSNPNIEENISNELYISPKVDTVSAVVSYQQCQNQELLNSDQSLISKCECLVNTVVNEKVTDPQVILNKCQVDILK